MANELRVRAELKYTPTAANQIAMDTGLLSKFVTMAGNDHSHGTQVIGIVDEQIALGADIGTLGYVLIVNLDPTNFVRVGVEAENYAIKIKPGEPQLFRPAANTLFAVADTAACKIQFFAFED